MKILNIITTCICIFLIIGTFYVNHDIEMYKNSIPNYNLDAQAGIGPAIIFMFWLIVNSIISFGFFVAILITGIVRKRLNEIYTIINILLLVFTFIAPVVIEF